MVRALYDVKATDMGSQSVMFKAEVDIDGREIARSYLERIDIHLILEVGFVSLINIGLIVIVGNAKD